MDSQSAYVTDLVSFNSTDEKVASINGDVVSGLSPGRSTIGVKNTSGYTIVDTDLVEVTDTPVYIESLSVAAISNATFAAVNATEGNTFTTTIELDQTLTEYGQRAGVSVTANFDDGHFMDITSEANMTSLVPNVLEMVSDSVGPQVEVVQGAWTIGLGKFIQATWDFSTSLLVGGGSAADQTGTCTEETVVNGTGNVAVNINAPTSVPTSQPSQPTNRPTSVPTSPTGQPTSQPTSPTGEPTATPTYPTCIPSSAPSGSPSTLPTSVPTTNVTRPTKQPTPIPTALPSAPTLATVSPSSGGPVGVSAIPTVAPTPAVSGEVTPAFTIPSPAPTVAPTPVNITATLRPTAALTHAPTINGPTLDPFDALSKLHPDIYPSAGFSIPTKNETYIIGTNDLGVIFGRPYDALFGAPPGTNGEYYIELADIKYTASNQKVTYSTTLLPVATLTAVIKTTVVYSTAKSIALTYQVADIFGAAQVQTTGLTVSMKLNVTTGVMMGAEQTFTCNSPSASTGIGHCFADPGGSWFSSTADTNVRVVLTAQHASMSSPGYVQYAPSKGITFQKTITYKPVTSGSVGFLATLNRPEPKFPGTVFTTTLSVSTGVHELHTWVLRVTYDSSVLSYVSAATASGYVDAVITFPSSTEVALSSASPSAGATESMLKGDSVTLVTLTWSINSLDFASPGVHANAFSAVAEDLVNSFTLSFAKNVNAQVNGEVTTTSGSSAAVLNQGQITVLNTNINGILVYSAQNEWVNSAPVDGVTISSPVIVLGVTNRATTTNDVSVSDSSTCYVANAVTDANILDPTGCVVKLNATHTEGAANVYVGVTHQTTVVATDGTSSTVIYSALTMYHIWFYIETELSVADKVLNLIVV